MDIAYSLLTENADEEGILKIHRDLGLDTPRRRHLEAKQQRRAMQAMGIPQISQGRRR